MKRLVDLMSYQVGGLTVDRIQKIINRYSGGKSPFTAQDYIEVSKSTGVPIDLLLAQGIQESNLGTQGRAVRTKNVGNVGNTDDGTDSYNNSWKDGLYRQANLLKKEYKVSGISDVQRLVSNDFIRPVKGGRYASAKNYGASIGQLLNKIHGQNVYSYSNVKGDNSDAVSNQTSDNNIAVGNTQYQMDPNMKPIDYSQSQFDNYMRQVMGNNVRYDFSTLPDDLKQNVMDNIKAQEERQKQQTEAQRVEQENLAIQEALEQKQQEKEQMLSMIPKATFVESEKTDNYINLLNQHANINFMQNGGKLGEKVYETYERITGKTWDTAKKEGLTDGSYSQNIKLQEELLNKEHETNNNNNNNNINQPIKKRGMLTIGDIESEFVDDKGEALSNYKTINKTDGSVERVKNENFKSLLDLLNNANNTSNLFKKYENIPQTTPNKTINKTDVHGKSNIPEKKDILDILGDMAYEGFKNFTTVTDKIDDHIDMAQNYINRHYFDENVKLNNSIVTQNTKKVEKVEEVEKDYLPSSEQDIYLHGDRKFVRGVFNLDKSKFEYRNRNDLTPVEKGDVALITTFKEFRPTPTPGYNTYLNLQKDGKVEIVNKDEMKNLQGVFSPITPLPLENLQFRTVKGEKQVKLVNSPDMGNKILDLGNVNSGVGVGKDFGEWANVNDLNNFSFLNGGKALFKVGNQKYMVSGSAKDLLDAYSSLSKKGKVEVFKLDNGSFNLPIKSKSKGVFDSEDLKAHQNRNNQGGHSLILIK